MCGLLLECLGLYVCRHLGGYRCISEGKFQTHYRLIMNPRRPASSVNLYGYDVATAMFSRLCMILRNVASLLYY